MPQITAVMEILKLIITILIFSIALAAIGAYLFFWIVLLISNIERYLNSRDWNK